MQVEQIVPQLIDFLRWKPETDVLKAVTQQRTKYICANLAARARLANSDLYDRLTKLAPSHQGRIVLAPRPGLLLTNGGDPRSLETVGDLIDIEKSLGEGGTELRNSKWTALGDMYFASTRSERDKLGAANGEELTYRAPIAGSIVVDAFSPVSRLGCPAAWGRAEAVDAASLPHIHLRICNRLTDIRKMNSSSFGLITSVVHVISVVSTRDNPDMTVGASLPPLAGRVLLTNPLSSNWSRGLLIYSLVHESIHSLLYTIETGMDFYSNATAAMELAAESPWSGRPLPLHSYVHACFVWYGLVHFWESTGLDGEGFSECSQKARSGFEKGSPLNRLSGTLRACIHPTVLQAIEAMPAQVAC